MAEQTAPPPLGETAGEPMARGRTAALPDDEVDRLFREGIALFNGVRYWHAHEAWETLWRAAPDDERDFFQGLILVAAGLLHLQRRNARGARNKLREGVEKLRPYHPTHRGIFVQELVTRSERILDDLDAGVLPYLIPPVIRFAD
jgi:predicted metal-dependent hydrolase